MSPEFYSLDSILRDEQIKAGREPRDIGVYLPARLIDIVLIRHFLSTEENQ